MSEYSTIKVNLSRKTATVTLARSEVHNAFNEQSILELTNAFTTLGEEKSIRAIILQGEGKHFCAGADLGYMLRSAELTFEQNIAAAKTMATMFRAIDRCPKPVIGRVHGAVLGGGIGLCAVCDTVVAIEDSKYSLSEIRLGILPAVIGPYTIAKIGYSNFRSLGISAERFNAVVALRIGLIHEVVSPEKIDDAIEKRVEALGSCAPEAIAVFKGYANRLGAVDNDAIIEHAAKLIATARTGTEGREGIAAFLEKRTAAWVESLS